MDVKQELARQAGKTDEADKREVTLTKGMSIADLIRAMAVDNAIQEEISVDMSEIQKKQPAIAGEYQEIKE